MKSPGLGLALCAALTAVPAWPNPGTSILPVAVETQLQDWTVETGEPVAELDGLAAVAASDERQLISFDNRARQFSVVGCPASVSAENCEVAMDETSDPKILATLSHGHDDDGTFVTSACCLLQLDDNKVVRYVPLPGGELRAGQVWPEDYSPVRLPAYLREYYNLGSDAEYRFADDVIFRFNPRNGLIGPVAALLAADGFEIGQPIPEGYDIYNIPAAWRTRFPRQTAAEFRYADGRIYRADATNNIVTDVYDLI